MKQRELFSFSSLFAGVALVLSLSGCSKKESPAAVQAPPQQADAPQPAPDAVPAAPAAPVSTAPVLSAAEVKANMEAADAAMKARDYEKAAATLMAVRAQQRLSEQQAEMLRSRMVQLQSSMAAAIAGGDPKAAAAADVLRQSASGVGR